MKNKILLISIASVLTFSFALMLSGCSSSKSAYSNQTSVSSTSSISNQTPASSAAPSLNQTVSTVSVQSSDKSVSISVPKGWNTNDRSLFTTVSISVSDVANSQYVIVNKKPKSGYPAGTTLDGFLSSEKTTLALLNNNPVWSTPTSTTLAGLEGETMTLTGTGRASKIDWTYWVTVLQDTNNFYMIAGYTTPDLKDKNQPVIEKVMSSLNIAAN